MGWAAETKHLEVDLKKNKFLEEEEDEEDEEEYVHVSSGRLPDGGWGYMVLLASFLCNMIVDGIGHCFYAASQEYSARYDATKNQLSKVGSTFFATYFLVGPVVGFLISRYGLRMVTMAGSLIAAFGFALSSQATTLEMLIITYGIIGGVGLGMMYVPSCVAVCYWFEKKRGLATGIAVSGSGVGQLIFPRLGTYLVNKYQLAGMHLMISGIVLQGLVCGAIFRPPDRWQQTRQKRCRQRVEIERGIIMRALIEDKKRQRTISDGSLDNCVITTNNRLIKLEPSLFHCKKNQALRNMLRRLGYSIQSLAVSKNSLQTSDQLVLMEALQHQQRLDHENNTAANSKTNSPQFLLPVSQAQLQKRNSSPDFKKVSLDQPQLNGGSGVVRSNSVMSNGIVSGNGLPKGSACSNGANTPVKTFPKTKSCDTLSQQPYMFLKKMMSERVRSSSECASSHSPNNPMSAQMLPLGSSPTLPVGSVDISIQEIDGSDAIGSCYTSNTSIATGISSHCGHDYEPNTSKNTFVATCMISGQQLEASIQELEKQEARENSFVLRWAHTVVNKLDVKSFFRATFALFLLSNLITSIAMYVPYQRISTLGISHVKMLLNDADLLTNIMGISSTVCRIIVGWLADRPWVNVIHLYTGTFIGAGICVMIMPFLPEQEWLCVFTAILGFCLAVFFSLRILVLVKILGVELLPKSFGIFCLVLGIASLVGSRFTELLGETQSLQTTFCVAGLVTMVSGILLLPLTYFRRKEEKKEAMRQADDEAEVDGHLMGSATAAITCPV